MRVRIPPIPPEPLRFMGESDEKFITIGDRTVRQLREVAGLRPDSSVVDIGCGYGRIAHALLRDDEFEGTYLGMDILPRHLEWCRENLASLRPDRFEFVHLDVRNDRYNPTGELDPTTVKLPARRRSADVAILLSVFTHMYPDQIRHYLKEVRRILKGRGRALMTFFLLNEEWEALRAKGVEATYDLAHELSPFSRTMRLEDPLHAIGFQQDWVLQQIAEAKLEPTAPIMYGSWSGREAEESTQDTLVIKRRAALPWRRS
jgi:SAM-dependent methyltransferase